MGTYNMGYYYDRGVRVGYDISAKAPDAFCPIYLSFVSSKDKARIIKEVMQATGVSRNEVTVIRDEY